MRVNPNPAGHVQRDQRRSHQGAEKFFKQLGVHIAQHFAGKRHAPRQMRTPRYINRRLGQRLIHRHQRLAKPGNPALVAQRLAHRRPQHNANIFNGVVRINVTGLTLRAFGIIDVDVGPYLQQRTEQEVQKALRVMDQVMTVQSVRMTNGALEADVLMDMDVVDARLGRPAQP